MAYSVLCPSIIRQIYPNGTSAKVRPECPLRRPPSIHLSDQWLIYTTQHHRQWLIERSKQTSKTTSASFYFCWILNFCSAYVEILLHCCHLSIFGSFTYLFFLLISQKGSSRMTIQFGHVKVDSVSFPLKKTQKNWPTSTSNVSFILSPNKKLRKNELNQQILRLWSCILSLAASMISGRLIFILSSPKFSHNRNCPSSHHMYSSVFCKAPLCKFQSLSITAIAIVRFECCLCPNTCKSTLTRKYYSCSIKSQNPSCVVIPFARWYPSYPQILADVYTTNNIRKRAFKPFVFWRDLISPEKGLAVHVTAAKRRRKTNAFRSYR